MCGLHGHSLRRLVCSAGTDFKGLEQAARQCRRSGLISSRIAKKLLALDAAFNVLRHVNSVRAERLLAELDAEVHVKTPDPASYTTNADAATCAATAASAPVNELAASERVIENVAPAPVGFHPVQEQMTVQEIPEIQVIERIQEQTEEQIVDDPSPPIVDNTAEVVIGNVQVNAAAGP